MSATWTADREPRRQPPSSSASWNAPLRYVLLVWALLATASCQDQGTNAVPDAGGKEPAAATSNLSALAIFEQRILPIFQAAKPSSCTECHLSGVDLKDYIRSDQAETFASLVRAGLIDTKHPRQSKILKFIGRRPEKPNLITEEVRRKEYEAFSAWISAAVADPKLLAAKAEREIGPQLPDEVIRHARKDRVLASFIDNIWSEVGRCAACHSADQNQKQVKEHGEHISWIKMNDPQATLNYLVDEGLIDTDDPDQSLLLLKPTVQEEHAGGQKMVIGDRSYKQFRRFLDDYARVVHGSYVDPKELPAPHGEVSLVTDIWFKLEGVPEEYDKLLLQVDLYRWTGSEWSSYRVATSDRPIFGKGKLWQQMLTLTAPRGSEWAKQLSRRQLPAGRYLVKVYLDRTGKLQKDFRAKLGDDDLVGQVEVTSQWPAGYGSMTVARFPGKESPGKR